MKNDGWLMSLYIGITRLSFGRDNVLTVVCKMLKIIQNDLNHYGKKELRSGHRLLSVESPEWHPAILSTHWQWRPLDNRRRPSKGTTANGGGTSSTVVIITTCAPRRRGAAKRATTHQSRNHVRPKRKNRHGTLLPQKHRRVRCGGKRMGSQTGSNQNVGKHQNLHVSGICKGESWW